MRPLHEPGVVPGTNVEVLELLHEGPVNRDIIYLVRHQCCGKVAKLSQHQIHDRIAKRSIKCRHCYRSARKMMKKRFVRMYFNFPDDLWDPPPSTLSDGHWIWEDQNMRGEK